MICHQTWNLAALLLASTASALVANRSVAPTAASNYARTPITSALSSSTSTDVPGWLGSVAESLLSEYYPSTTITNIASITWPGTVVIGGTTYTLPRPSEATSAEATSGFPSPTVNPTTSPKFKTSARPMTSQPLSTHVTPTSSSTAMSSETSKSSSARTPSETTTTASSRKTSSTPTTSSTSMTSTTASNRPTQTNTSDAANNSDIAKDQKIAIILGVVLGIAALSVLLFAFLCLRRRRNKTGSYFKHRRSHTPTDSEIGSEIGSPRGQDWTSHDPDDPSLGLMGGATHGPSSSTRYPPMATHPNYTQLSNPQGRMDQNPFLTPDERAAAGWNHNYPNPQETGGTVAGIRGGGDSPKSPTQTGRIPRKPVGSSPPIPRKPDPSFYQRSNRPPTPLDPLLSAPPADSSPRRFSFEEDHDDEEDDVVSPMVPPKNYMRRNSPVVHYPSWAEINSFDFTSNGHGNGYSNGYSNGYGNGHQQSWSPEQHQSGWDYDDARWRQGR